MRGACFNVLNRIENKAQVGFNKVYATNKDISGNTRPVSINVSYPGRKG
jgi:hypothetical protein